MHFIVGHPEDYCSSALTEHLAARGYAVRFLANLLDAPARYSLRIEPDGRTGHSLAFGEGPAELIESMFVRSRRPLDPSGWDATDHAYMQAESEAVTLAWLSALDCPVVNRLNAEVWYRSRPSLLHWLPLLRGCDLRIPETIVTDSREALASFRAQLDASDVPGAIFHSLSQGVAWLVSPAEWSGVNALQDRGPVCLAEPHGAVNLLCIVRQQILWARPPSVAEQALSDRLVRFAEAAGLDFVEIALGEVRAGPAVVHVDPLPVLAHFDEEVQGGILDALADLLTASAVAMQMEVQP